MTSFSRKAKAEAAKYQHQIHPKHRHKYTFASDCGAGSQGNKGFQPGNTCGGDGDGKNDAGDQGGGDKSKGMKAATQELRGNAEMLLEMADPEDMEMADVLVMQRAHLQLLSLANDLEKGRDEVALERLQNFDGWLVDEVPEDVKKYLGDLEDDLMLDEMEDDLAAEDAAAEREQKQAEDLDSFEDPLAAEDAAAEREQRQAEALDLIEDPLAAEDAGDMLDVYETMSVDDIGDSEKKAIKDAATQLFEDGETIHEVSAKLETHPDVIGELVDLDVVAQADDAGEEAEALAEEDYLADLSESELEEVLGPGSRREEIEQQLANNPEMSDEEVNEAVQELRSIRTEEVRNAIQGGPDYSELNAQIASMSQGNATEQDLGQLKDDLSNIAYQNQGKLSAAIQGEGKRNDESIMGQYRAYQDLVDGMEIQSVEDLQRYSDLTSKAFNDLYNSIYGIPSAAPEDRG